VLLSDMARRLDCQYEGLPTLEIVGVAALEAAQAGDLSFLAESQYAPLLESTQASAVILDETTVAPSHLACLRTPQPRLAFARAIEWFYQPNFPPVGIHPSAQIDPSATLGADVSVGPYAVVMADVTIGDRTQIHAGATIYPNVVLGRDCILYAHCSIHERTQMGNECRIHSGAVVGDDGFGYVPQSDGSWYRMLQSGRVVLGDRVDVGSNATIDRPAVGETRIGTGTKIDNLVQVGHGVVVGENSLLCAQVGIAGGTTIGRNVVLAGQVGVTGHVTVGDRVVAAARSGITGHVSAHCTVAGYPHQPDREWRRSVAVQRHLPELQKTVRELQKRIQSLERDIAQAGSLDAEATASTRIDAPAGDGKSIGREEKRSPSE
jgi:UDP-3-O-[3-hydroxymyristoyl] glucosamine N-acyltransferase